MKRQSREIEFRIPARLESLVELEKKVKNMTSDLTETSNLESEQYSFTLALHELCVNIIEHAYQGSQGDIQIKLALQFEPATMNAFIVDSGIPFDPDGAAAPDLDNPQEGGYGLFLIEMLVDAVEYKRVMGRNEWQITRVFD